ncbi:dTMP kinase [Ostreibacterium oceani]|nr:dTMP kinase [Ostreibacterium oceani]
MNSMNEQKQQRQPAPHEKIAPGQFITFDGIDGAGKSTQIELLANALRQQGKTVHVTREPGGTVISEKIRELLLSTEQQMTTMTELLLMFAARAEHIQTVLKPKVAAGDWVICSRFTDATMAYQGYARGADLAVITQLAALVHDDFQPSLSFLLDLPAEAAAVRRQHRGEAIDRFEAEALSFMQRVRDGYLAIAHAHPERCVVVDATQSVEQMAAVISQAVSRL